MNRWILAALIHECSEKLKIPSPVLASALHLMDNAVVLFSTQVGPREKAWHEKCEPHLLAAVCTHLASKLENNYVSMTALLSHFFLFTSTGEASGTQAQLPNAGGGTITASELQKQALYDQANAVEALLVVEMGIYSALPLVVTYWELHRMCKEWALSTDLKLLSFHILFQLLHVTPFAGRYNSRIVTALSLFIASQWLSEPIMATSLRGSTYKPTNSSETSNANGEAQEGWWCFIHPPLRRSHLVTMMEQFLAAARILPMQIRTELAKNKENGLREELSRIEENCSKYAQLDAMFPNVVIPREGTSGGGAGPHGSNMTTVNGTNPTSRRSGLPVTKPGSLRPSSSFGGPTSGPAVAAGGGGGNRESYSSNVTPQTTPGPQQTTGEDTDLTPNSVQSQEAPSGPVVSNKQRISMQDYRQKLQTARPLLEEPKPSPNAPPPAPDPTTSNKTPHIVSAPSEAPPSTMTGAGEPFNLPGGGVGSMPQQVSRQHSQHHHHDSKHREHKHKKSKSSHSRDKSSSSAHHRHHSSHSPSKHKKRKSSTSRGGENLLNNLLQTSETVEDMDISPS